VRKIKNNPATYKTRTRLVLKDGAPPKSDRVKTRSRVSFIRNGKFDERGYVKIG
jgi:hypothetical protein